MPDTPEPIDRAMPDVARESAQSFAALEAVGMSAIEMPVLVDDGAGNVVRHGARIDAFVDLVGSARGIHMSRLYLLLDQHLSAQPLTRGLLERVLKALLDSHAGLSTRASLRIRYDRWLRRRALASDNSGWRAYPVAIDARRDALRTQIAIEAEVVYSSTCPASAALARQAIQARFEQDFVTSAVLDRAVLQQWLGSAGGIVATPHSQRSTARVRVELAADTDLPTTDLIDLVEDALQTPVQSAVKREDEQVFALRNGSNAMFCEDAARRIAVALDTDARFVDFEVRAEHHESLHPHDAVAIARKPRATHAYE